MRNLNLVFVDGVRDDASGARSNVSKGALSRQYELFTPRKRPPVSRRGYNRTRYTRVEDTDTSRFRQRNTASILYLYRVEDTYRPSTRRGYKTYGVGCRVEGTGCRM